MTERFHLLHTDGKARRGRYDTPHGSFHTPNFMPVGTQGSVKGVDAERLSDVGAQIILVNTYHLWLRPTPSVVRALGDIHGFSGWKGPILSDSGGFQIFSLKSIRTLKEEGVEFRSHIDGKLCFLSPEIAIQIQQELGVDIAMVLDECPAATLERDAVERSLALTLRWAERSLNARTVETMSIFGITQGGMYRDLRERSIAGLREIHERRRAAGAPGFDGFAIGGLSVGESKEEMYGVLDYHPQQLPAEKIRYVMGVGTPLDIITAVINGVDLFDCVMPTRAGRFGRAFVSGPESTLNIKNARFVLDSEPLDAHCRCLACRNYSRGYINHLFKAGEMLGPQLLSVHNLAFYLSFMGEIRAAIEKNELEALYQRERGRAQGAEPRGEG